MRILECLDGKKDIHLVGMKSIYGSVDLMKSKYID